jgi:RNA polymerase sigma factor (sigma-70 family)
MRLEIPYKESCKDFLWLTFKDMMTAMATDEPSSLKTRPSLLNRLKSGDGESWQDFYRIYGMLVRDFAIQAGLTNTEADEVVQETAIAMARHLPEYQYNPKVCRFKTWLLNQTSWRIKDQFKKRKKEGGLAGGALARADEGPALPGDESRTDTINRVPDTAAADLDAVFESQWRKNLFDAAMERVKTKFSLKQFQIFDLLVLQEWPAATVAQSLGVSLANVYVTRHRISSAIKKETKHLETQLEKGGLREDE